MGYLLVFIGSGLGGVLRHGAGLLSLRWFGPEFPWGTLAVNIVGSGLIGLAAGLFITSNLGNQDLRLFLTTGLLGGFTTFSAFSLDAVSLWERGRHLAAAGYVLASVAVSLAALVLVLALVRRWG